jgi:6-phosphogluconolactonase
MAEAQFRVFDDLQQAAEAAAEEFIARYRRSIEQRGRYMVALSGGSSPKPFHASVAQRSNDDPKLIDWTRVHLFWGDDRFVPPDHPDSNYRMARETLISRVPIPAENVHRIHCENPDPRQVAVDYEKELRKAFRLKDSQLPRFDLMLLGMGPEGHTASMFPGSAGLHVTDRQVVANWIEKLKTWRITTTFPVINHAECDLLLVAGKDKAEALAQVRGEGDPDEFPVKRVQPTHGDLIWMVDKAAAGQS